MRTLATLSDTLDAWAQRDGFRRDVAAAVASIAEAGRDIAERVALGPLADEEAGVDASRTLAGWAGARLLDALGPVPVAAVAQSDDDGIVDTGNTAPLAAALVPFCGAADVETTGTVGTMFSLLPAVFDGGRPSPSCFLQPGARQVAAGYVVYGPFTALVLTVGEGTAMFVLNRASGIYELATERCAVPEAAGTLTVSATDSRHWEDAIKSYIDDRLEELGAVGDAAFQMHRDTSLVADCHRVLHRGGTQLYPSEIGGRGATDRLTLVFEANPVAWLTEQAGGGASTGTERVLDVIPGRMRERTPLVFGAREEVRRIERFQTGRCPNATRSPLFFRRGLFLA